MEQQLRDQLNREIVNYMQSLESYLLNLQNVSPLELFTTLHGLKGLLGTVRAEKLQMLVHHLEQQLSLKTANTFAYLKEISHLIDQLKITFKHGHDDCPHPIITIDRIQLIQPQDHIEVERNFYSFELIQLFCQRFPVSNFICSVQHHADQIRGHQALSSLKIHPKAFSLLLQIIPHLVNNSIAHAQLPAGCDLVLHFFYKPSTSEFIYQDNGQPINLDHLRSKLKSFNFFSSKQVERFTAEQLFNFMLMPGFTTAEKVDVIKGRGIGLTHTKKLLEDAGGKILLAANGENKLITHIKFPLSWTKVSEDYFVAS